MKNETAQYRRAANHYDSGYFEQQSQNGAIGARLNATMFKDYIGFDGCVLDFGCGGGFLLHELGVAKPLGVDINPSARAFARGSGIEVFENIDQISNGVVDVIISNHALEHTEDPLDQLRKMAKKLKPGGRLILVVPCDIPSYPYIKDDRDFHLFSWSANNISNLVQCANFKVEKAEQVHLAWPPRWQWIHRKFGMTALRLCVHIWGYLPRQRKQVRVVARKRGDSM